MTTSWKKELHNFVYSKMDPITIKEAIIFIPLSLLITGTMHYLSRTEYFSTIIFSNFTK